MTVIPSLGLIFFLALAPIMPAGVRRSIALLLGVGSEAFSTLPFGIAIGMFVVGVFLIGLFERTMTTREPIGWATTVLSSMATVALLHMVALIMFEAVTVLLATALFISELTVGVLVIGFLWVPVKLSMRR